MSSTLRFQTFIIIIIIYYSYHMFSYVTVWWHSLGYLNYVTLFWHQTWRAVAVRKFETANMPLSVLSNSILTSLCNAVYYFQSVWTNFILCVWERWCCSSHDWFSVCAVCFTFKGSVPHARGDLRSILLSVSVFNGFMQGDCIQQHGIMESLDKHVDLKWVMWFTKRKWLYCCCTMHTHNVQQKNYKI